MQQPLGVKALAHVLADVLSRLPVPARRWRPALDKPAKTASKPP
jgi:hypothetical protein